MYNTKKAATYWSKRIKNYDLQTAVLSLSFPEYLNNAYAQWESNILKKEIGNVNNKTILDIGCGGGRNSIPLAKMGAKVTGVDISSQMLDFAKNNSKKNKCSKNTNFILSSAWETSLPSKSFDKILLLGILEHMPEEYRKKTIKETKRLLKKGVSTPRRPTASPTWRRNGARAWPPSRHGPGRPAQASSPRRA